MSSTATADTVKATRQPSSKPHEEARLLRTRDAAAMLGQALSTFQRQRSLGLLPRPVTIGNSVRWDRVELAAWIEAGCPTQDKWKAMKEAACRRDPTRGA